MGYLKIVCGVLIWAVINGLVVKGISQQVSPTILGSMMSLVGMLPILLLNKRIIICSSDKKILAILGIVAALNNSFFYTAIAIKDVSTVVLVHYFAATLAVVWTRFVPRLKEKFDIWSGISVVLALIGLLIMLGKQWFVFETWMIFALLSALFYSWEIIYSRICSKEGILPMHSSLSKLGFQFLLMPCVGISLGHSMLIPYSAWPEIIIAGLLLVYSFHLVFSGLLTVSATHFAVLSYLDRIGAIAIGFIWWQEPITTQVLVGGALILVAEVPIIFPKRKEA